MRSVELLENKFGYYQDNPAIKYGTEGLEWLKNKQDDAERAPRMKMLTGAVTASMGVREPMYLPVDVLVDIPGARDEDRRPGEAQFDHLLAKVKENGFVDGDPILVGINHYGKAYVLEGNTRIAVCKAIGHPYLKAEVKWFNGAETYNGRWSPEYFSEIAKNHLMEGDANGWGKRLPLNRIKHLSDQERFEIVHFMYQWLGGSFMNHTDNRPLEMWRKINSMFPVKISGEKSLYRLITAPIRYADMRHFVFKPAKTPVSSWTTTKFGLDTVAGVANELDQNFLDKTARIAIEAKIPANRILATHNTMKMAFLTLTHDFHERFPDEEIITQTPTGGTVHRSKSHTDWPKFDDHFDIEEVGYIQACLSQYKGGYLRQYEVIVESPEEVEAKLVRVYRKGSDILRYGNDDPHN